MTGPWPRPQELVERALSVSSADDCVVIVEEISEANLRWASNTLTTNGVTRSRDVTVIAVVDNCVGVVTEQRGDVESVSEAVKAAERTARDRTPSEDVAELAGPAGSYGDWEAPPAETSIAVFVDFAPDLGAALDRAASSGELLFGFADHQMVSTFLGTSRGYRGRFDQPAGHAEMNAKSPDYGRSAWAGLPTDDFKGIDVVGLTSGLSQRLEWAKRPVELPAGRYEAVLPPGAVSDLMIPLYWSAGARDAHDGRTVFSRPGGGTRVGDRLTDVALDLRSDPAARSLECAPFTVAHSSDSVQSVFDNGSSPSPTEWISGGVLKSLMQTRHSAGLTGLPFTPYIDNLILDGPATGTGGAEDLARGLDRGLLLTCLWYIREVDPQTLLLTGLTRDGVYLVEGGEVVGAVNNFRFNESPVDVLARVVEAGACERTLPREWGDYFTRASMPALRVADFNMSSVSQAA